MSMQKLTHEQLACFNAAIELASASIISGKLDGNAESVQDYVSKMYPALKQIVNRLTL